MFVFVHALKYVNLPYMNDVFNVLRLHASPLTLNQRKLKAAEHNFCTTGWKEIATDAAQNAVNVLSLIMASLV